ncbi:MAG: hypothetical protein K6F50_00190, partial [Kiritimatiellae bacterium]|nr:hypothetical protein [Kiritimatiellia bacterium]
ALAYECLSGEPPFCRGQIEFQIDNDTPAPLPGGPRSCASAIMSGLAKKPEDRPKSCALVLKAKVVVRDAPLPVRHIGAVRTQPVRRRRTWMRRLVFPAILVAGLAVSHVTYVSGTEIYEAVGEFTLEASGGSGADRAAGRIVNLTEMYNTLLPSWRTPEVFKRLLGRYREKSVREGYGRIASDEEISAALADSRIELKPNSRLLQIAVRSKDPVLAKDLAEAYVAAISEQAEEENKRHVEDKVREVHEQVLRCERERTRISEELSGFRITNNVDVLRARRDTLKQSIATTADSILKLERRVTELEEWAKGLNEVQSNPERFGVLDSGVPRAQEILTEFNAMQKAALELEGLRRIYAAEHPLVRIASGDADAAKQRFISAIKRALDTGSTNLKTARNQLDSLRKRRTQMQNELQGTEQHIVLAESGICRLENELNICNSLYEELYKSEMKLREEAMKDNVIVRPGRDVPLPLRPVLPNPYLIFGIGFALSLGIGLLCLTFCFPRERE